MSQEAITSPYVDYKYYSDTYGGEKVPEDSFETCEKRAEAVLHQITFGRVKQLPEIPDLIKDAICAMVEVKYQEDKKQAGLKSETIDGYSVTYESSGGTAGASGTVKLMYEEAKVYLANTGLLYRGWSKKYDEKQ